MSSNVQELFHENAQGSQMNAQPWWKVKLFVWEPVLFGTWDGVFTTCMINIFGVVLFLRTGWLVGNTGVLLGMLLVSLVVLVALVTVMSGMGVCERCTVGSGGVYSMISMVLGGRVGGTVGLLYVFGQCVAGAMYITGFAESIAEVLTVQSVWAVRGISVAVLLALLGINLAGVKWIVRLQLILLAILAVSTLDFIIGTFSHLDPEHGFVGYSEELLWANTLPDYTAGETFFTVFGVFFPAATGVMAGFNMSSDLHKPEHSIPLGTLAAVFTSWFLYLVFVFLLGAICTRDALRSDFLIAEKVSLVGFLFLLGLYVSSLASCMGGLYGAPRVLQCIAQERVIPALSFLGHGKGPNKTPVAAICLTSLISMAFIFIGQVNILAPIVTINFMLTYSIIDYSYFSVAMSYKLQVKERRPLIKKPCTRKSLVTTNHPCYGSNGTLSKRSNGTLLEFTKDMDQIFTLPGADSTEEEKASNHVAKVWGRKAKVSAKETLSSSFGLDLNSNSSSEKEKDERVFEQNIDPDDETSSQTGLIESEPGGKRKLSLPTPSPIELNHISGETSDTNDTKPKLEGSDIRPVSNSCYAKFCNHWASLIGALCSILIMFVIQWVYALVNISVALLLYLYIGNTSPGLPTGIAAHFSFYRWIKRFLSSLGSTDIIGLTFDGSATDQSSLTEFMEHWTTETRSDISTELMDSSPALSPNTVSEWEDPSTIANITNAYTVAEEWLPAREFRTVRELTVTKLTESEQVDQDITESGSSVFKQKNTDQDTTVSDSSVFKQKNTDQDTTESDSSVFKQKNTDQDTTESDSSTFKQKNTDQDTTESDSSTFKQKNTDQDTTESDSSTFKQKHTDKDTTESGSSTFKQKHTDKDTTESDSSTFKQKNTDQDTTESDSSTFKQKNTDQDTTESGSSTFKQKHTDKDTTESDSSTFKQKHTDKDTTESDSSTFKQKHTDKDTTESGSSTFKQKHTDKDTTESDSSTFKQKHTDKDTTESGSSTFKQKHTDKDTTESDSSTFKQKNTDQDTTESDSSTFKQKHTDKDTTESGSSTFKQKHTDKDTTESGSSTFKQKHTDKDTTESGSSTFKQKHTDKDTTESDQDTTESDSSTFKQKNTDQDTTESDSSTFKQKNTDKDTTESDSSTFKQKHTDKDTTESDSSTFKQKHTDKDTTEFGSNTDSTYISTTLSRAGERTLLSITSNSTSPYVEDTSVSSSEITPSAVTGQVEETGVTKHMEYTEDNESGRSEATPEDAPTNTTQKEVFETRVSHGSQTTQSHTGQPTVRGSDFDLMPKTSDPSSTPPLTVINSSDSEMDTTANSSTNQSFYTDSSSPSSFIPPSVVPDDSHTNVSEQDGESTETFTGPVSTSTGKKPHEPSTFMEETTIPGLTTVPSTPWEMTTSVHESQSTQQTFFSETNSPPEPSEALSTATGPLTQNPPLTEENTHKASTIPDTSTKLNSKGTTAPLTTRQFQASTTEEVYSTPHSTLSVTETTKKTMTTTEQHNPTTGTATSSLSGSSSKSGAGATDVSTLHIETSTATPGSTSAHSQHTTASYKSTPTISTMVITTAKRTETEATTTQMPMELSLTPGHMCRPQICANGGKCVLTLGGYRCECLPAWKGENCTEDVDECVSSPCPQDSLCVNTRGSFSCECALGYDLQDGRSCTQTRTFLGIFSMNNSLHDSHREILQLALKGLRHLDGLQIMAVNMFTMSANVTSIDIFSRIQMSITNCNKPQSHCYLKHQHQLNYQMKSLCLAQRNRCDTQYAVCSDSDGTPYCQCHEGYFKKNPEDSTCRDCGDGFKLVNGTCMECPFGFGGFNCNNFYGLIAKVVSPAAGGLLLIVVIALIVTCCRKDKNDINKIIFKSGDLQMSPYGDFPKSSRVSMEWGRETIEMQENGSTKNLLQMTDIYYSPALRNADLDRNGLYPFSGLPGSRHSCIYPAQWNPSFISDDSRRRDYF
ncbi:hypothetical protein QTP86_021583 [Hemibagrus guttatus]|nr:hypothetical protein QTP86_021583 [Hemibagrus guttatus]